MRLTSNVRLDLSLAWGRRAMKFSKSKIFYARVLIAVYLLSGSAVSFAAELLNQKVAAVGAHTGQTVYLYLASDALRSAGCQFEVLYCPSSNPDCKSMAAVALAARTSGSNSVYVAYDKDGSNVCTMTNIRF